MASIPDESDEDGWSERPIFQGRWLLTGYEGDMDALLLEMGVGWAVRRLAKGFNYGVGTAVQDIAMNGEEMVLITESGHKTISMTATIGGEEAESIGLDGELNYVTMTWEGRSIRTESRSKDGKLAPPTLRYFEKSDMVVETRPSNGEIVRRFYSYQGESKQPQ